MATPLTVQEQQTLEHHLAIIRTSFLVMIKTLSVIHAQKLYRGADGSRTWERFCKEELNFSARYGSYFITAFSILETIEEHNTTTDQPLPLPSKEAHTRALSDAPREMIVEGWQATTQKYGANPTARNIRQTIEEMTVSEALIMRGVTDGAVLTVLESIADKSEHGRGIVTELLNTGYLQPLDEEDAIPLSDVRLADLRHYEEAQRKEAIARRVADEGGVVITVYPNNPTKTAGILRGSMTSEQLRDLLYEL